MILPLRLLYRFNHSQLLTKDELIFSHKKWLINSVYLFDRSINAVTADVGVLIFVDKWRFTFNYLIGILGMHDSQMRRLD